MVRTGARAEALRALLTQAGFRPLAAGPTAPRLDAVPAQVQADLHDLYRTLGGVNPNPSFRPGSWDLAFADGLVVELDEELHFNRYRTHTLQPPWATPLPWRDAYLGFSQAHERQCLDAGKWGKRWTNPSCEVMFGPPSAPGDFAGGGAPRWKQRAFYDAVKDVAALDSSATRLARLSVWDVVGNARIGEALNGGTAINVDQLHDLVVRRTTSNL